jgi:hypothetical protein
MDWGQWAFHVVVVVVVVVVVRQCSQKKGRYLEHRFGNDAASHVLSLLVASILPFPHCSTCVLRKNPDT